MAYLFTKEPLPVVCHLQFLIVSLIVVVSLGHAVVDIAQRTDVTLFVLHQFGIVLQGVYGWFRLLHVQIDDANLLVGHRMSQFVVALLGIAQHALCLLKCQLQLSHCTQGIRPELPATVIVVPLLVVSEPFHLDQGFFCLFLCHREVLEGLNLLPSGLTLFLCVTLLMVLGYLVVDLCQGFFCIPAIRVACVK